ncbi:MAG: hypothetical protein Pg6A_09500 [Termitinemataceae bacterium]|nr:MAG: hypothetical protein Pg6A_09500 [Termitinemataceae bacterium]
MLCVQSIPPPARAAGRGWRQCRAATRHPRPANNSELEIICVQTWAIILNKRCLQTPAQAIEAEFASEAQQIGAESAVFAGLC